MLHFEKFLYTCVYITLLVSYDVLMLVFKLILVLHIMCCTILISWHINLKNFPIFCVCIVQCRYHIMCLWLCFLNNLFMYSSYDFDPENVEIHKIRFAQLTCPSKIETHQNQNKRTHLLWIVSILLMFSTVNYIYHIIYCYAGLCYICCYNDL